MDTLHKTLMRIVGNIPKEIVSEIIGEKLKSKGIVLKTSQLNNLVERIIDGESDTFRINSWQWWTKSKVTIEITQDDIDQLEKRADRFSGKKAAELVSSVSSDVSDIILAELKRTWSRKSRRQERQSKAFHKEINNRWGDAINALRMQLEIAKEFAEESDLELQKQEEADHPYLSDSLVRLHARACQVAEEIILLLEAGLADGAMARWRTLHEIAVVALLLQTHGEDLAERYVLHLDVEARKAARQLEQYHARINQDPPTKAELTALDETYEQLIDRFGKSFGSNYGWAAFHLGMENPKIAHLEQASEIDHWRPYYRTASYNVHANPHGLYFRLGLISELDVILAGPSIFGLADPGHSTAISLTLVSMSLALLRLNFDKLVLMQIMFTHSEKIGELFLEIEAKYESVTTQ